MLNFLKNIIIIAHCYVIDKPKNINDSFLIMFLRLFISTTCYINTNINITAPLS